MKPNYGVDGELICICGHGESVHDLIGRDKYTSCRMWQPDCHCDGGFRPIVRVWSGFKLFKRTARGGDFPHSLYGALWKLDERGGRFEWVGPLECDFCHHAVSTWRDLTPYALDEHNAPMFRPDRQTRGFSSRDTGHHALLCGTCETAQQEIARLEADMKQAAEDAEFEAAVRAAGG